MRNSSFFLYRLLVPVKFSYRDTKLLIDRFPRDVARHEDLRADNVFSKADHTYLRSACQILTKLASLVEVAFDESAKRDHV